MAGFMIPLPSITRATANWSLAVGFVLNCVSSCRSEVPPQSLPLPSCPTAAVVPSVPVEVIVPKAPPTPKCGLPEDLKRPEWPTVLSGTNEQELDPAPSETATLVLLPDTQYYTACRYPHLKNQANFIAQERERRHLIGAISLGDITDHNSDGQWTFARESLSVIPPEFPLLLTTGNHDTGSNGTTEDRESLLSKYFTESWARQSGALKELMTSGSIENAFYSLDAGQYQLGVLVLEWAPRRKTVEWANQVVTRYKNHRVIVATHAYLYDDGTRYDYATRGKTQRWNPLEYLSAKTTLAAEESFDGEMLWNSFVRRHGNIFLVVSGHVLNQGTARLTSRGDAGNVVHQLLADYQMLDEGGLGYLQLLEFYPDGKTLHMKTYSPSLGQFSYATGQDYRLEVEPPLFSVKNRVNVSTVGHQR
jgi:hypothetical protein